MSDLKNIRPKIQQMAVHFASTIPLKSELKDSERNSLKSTLEEIDPEQFQIFSQPPNPNVLFFVQRQYQLDSNIATGPSLALERQSLAIFKAIKIQNTMTTTEDSLFAEGYNQRARDILYRVQNAIKVKYTRVGKIFELVLGPYTQEEIRKILGNMVRIDTTNLADLQLVTTNVINSNNRALNINTRVQFMAQPNAPFSFLQLRIDINNRRHESSLEPRDVESIWKEADKLIAPELERILA